MTTVLQSRLLCFDKISNKYSLRSGDIMASETRSEIEKQLNKKSKKNIEVRKTAENVFTLYMRTNQDISNKIKKRRMTS